MLSEKTQFKNAESPFTELFSILKRDKILSNGLATLGHDTKALKVMQQHVDNAMDVLLQGLQDLGNLIGMSIQNKKDALEDLNNIGFFISAISNLTEALNALRLDADYMLKKSEGVNS